MKQPSITYDSWGMTTTVFPELGHYGNGRLAISFIDDFGDSWGTATVNLPDQHLNDGELFVKDWAENEPMISAMIKAGWLVMTGREVASGYVNPKVMKPAGELTEWIANQSEAM